MSNPLHLKGESLKIIAIILLGWTFFAFADTTSKFLTQTHAPSLIITINAAISSTLLCLWILFHKGWRGFLSPNWKWLIARGTCIGITATGVVNAFSHIPLADVYGITFAAPFLTVCLAYFLLKEAVGWHRWLSVIVGFIGVLILVGPQFNTINIGLLYAMMATIAIALGVIVVRKIGKNEYLPLFILYPFIGMLIVNVPMIYSEFYIPPIAELSGFILNTALVFCGVILTTYGLAHANSTASVAPFVYVQVIWGVAFGYFIFDDIPTTTTIIGLIIVISAGLYMIHRERQLNKKKK